MTLDIKRLSRDASRFQAERSMSPSSRETTGTTKAIRDVLPQIYSLREAGVQWSAIASALAAQGIVQGKARIPLTTNRLTALVRQIELQNQRRAAKQIKESSVSGRNEAALGNHGVAGAPGRETKTRMLVENGVRQPRRRNEPISEATDSQKRFGQ